MPADIGRMIHAHLADVEQYLHEIQNSNLDTLADWRVLTQPAYEKLLHSRVVVVQEIRDQLQGSSEVKPS